jgi:hypothetical protein
MSVSFATMEITNQALNVPAHLHSLPSMKSTLCTPKPSIAIPILRSLTLIDCVSLARFWTILTAIENSYVSNFVPSLVTYVLNLTLSCFHFTESWSCSWCHVRSSHNHQELWSRSRSRAADPRSLYSAPIRYDSIRQRSRANGHKALY